MSKDIESIELELTEENLGLGGWSSEDVIKIYKERNYE